ncbi:MAG TPA: glutamate racemase [Bacilli bacterium]|nr:glutamate racemase [Bacilli bacterium]HQD92318.1 glutamate racemase [Bacilli bacterium]
MKRPIGVFDSGIGGITVLDSLIDVLPNEDFIYVGDTLNCPYGVKTPAEIEQLVTNVTKYLLSQNVKAIVIACNTATANSKHLKSITNIPIIGVIEPTARKALEVTKNNKITVLATQATVNSKAYYNLLTQNNAQVHQLGCPEFVELVESGEITSEKSYAVVDQVLESLKGKDFDTVILGCTHFKLLTNQVKNVFKSCEVVNSGMPTALELYSILQKENLLETSNTPGKVIINTTKDANKMKQIISSWFKKEYDGVYEIVI